MADFSKSRRSTNVEVSMWRKGGANVHVPLAKVKDFYKEEATYAEVRQQRRRATVSLAKSPGGIAADRRLADHQRETGPGGYRGNQFKKKKKKK